MAAPTRPLIDVVESYLSMRRLAGYQLRRESRALREFAKFTAAHHCRHVTTDLAIRWSEMTSSAWLRVNRIRAICRLAEYVRAEDTRHEVPPRDYFGRYPRQRPTPYILSRLQILGILDAAAGLGRGRHGSAIRPHLFRTLFALIAATGLRIGEGLGLRHRDVTSTGLVIHKTKTGRGRVLPIHETTHTALDDYWECRRRMPCETDHLFVTTSGLPLSRSVAATVFRQLVTVAKIPRRRGVRGPVIHSLRHTFAVRALESCQGDSRAVAEHMQAVTRYLGHSNIAHTYWYYESTPHLMRAVAQQSEAHAREAVG